MAGPVGCAKKCRAHRVCTEVQGQGLPSVIVLGDAQYQCERVWAGVQDQCSVMGSRHWSQVYWRILSCGRLWADGRCSERGSHGDSSELPAKPSDAMRLPQCSSPQVPSGEAASHTQRACCTPGWACSWPEEPRSWNNLEMRHRGHGSRKALLPAATGLHMPHATQAHLVGSLN